MAAQVRLATTGLGRTTSSSVMSAQFSFATLVAEALAGAGAGALLSPWPDAADAAAAAAKTFGTRAADGFVVVGDVASLTGASDVFVVGDAAPLTGMATDSFVVADVACPIACDVAAGRDADMAAPGRGATDTGPGLSAAVAALDSDGLELDVAGAAAAAAAALDADGLELDVAGGAAAAAWHLTRTIWRWT